ncbi:hypothetical protein PVAND_016977 [Polypedilum vanderplanki]|uniref:Uncharacterized protein n=1 Tax=Polypedilum vanderplanki TaxID=319348 RepID=A0A9J6BI06_POLVA|nr:hypothetical protein PVAND_016977 [Polypedilum vanderplanki]
MIGNIEVFEKLWKKLKEKSEIVLKLLKVFMTFFPIYIRSSYKSLIFYLVGDKKEHWCARLFRVTISTIAFIICLFLTTSTYQRWQLSPVSVNFDDDFTDVSEIPFPAVTICYNSKVDLDSFNVSNLKEFIDPKSREILVKGSEFYLETLSQLCQFGNRKCRGLKNNKSKQTTSVLYRKRSAFKFLQLHDFKLNMTGVDYAKNLLKISVIDFISELKFLNDDDYFYETPIYRRMITEEGICYTINMLDNSEMYTDEMADYLIDFGEIDEGFERRKNLAEYPPKTTSSGRDYGLTIFTPKLEENFNSMCSDKDGFKIKLHPPHEFPRMSSHYIDIPDDDTTIIAVKPSAIKTFEELRKYDPKVRHCYFDGERKLKFFRYYTQANCEYECYIKRLYSTCGCVAFFMPHKNDTRICQSSEEKSCHCQFRENWGRAKDCGCLASCTSISYDTEITSSKREVTDDVVEQVSIYFKKDYFLRVIRTEAVGWANFWAAIGGFLGLLMGASVLSVIELFYCVFVKHVLDKKEENDEKIKVDNLEL